MVSIPNPMKPKILPTVILVILASSTGCSDSRQEEKAKADAEAKARAEAAKKEMETLPKVFRSRDIFQKVEPAKTESKPAEPAHRSK